jgi:hypothetical protein
MARVTRVMGPRSLGASGDGSVCMGRRTSSTCRPRRRQVSGRVVWVAVGVVGKLYCVG